MQQRIEKNLADERARFDLRRSCSDSGIAYFRDGSDELHLCLRMSTICCSRSSTTAQPVLARVFLAPSAKTAWKLPSPSQHEVKTTYEGSTNLCAATDRHLFFLSAASYPTRIKEIRIALTSSTPISSSRLPGFLFAMSHG